MVRCTKIKHNGKMEPRDMINYAIGISYVTSMTATQGNGQNGIAEGSIDNMRRL